MLESATSENKPPAAAKPFPVSKITGICLILLAVAIAVFIQCPTKVQYFIIYALIGLGIALLLAKSAQKSNLTFNIWNIGVALAGGVALPFILFFTNPIGNFKPDNCDLPVSVTVFVHGKGGKQDMIMRQQGHVIMDLKGERKKAFISENGEAYFENLRIGDDVRLNIDFSEPYKALDPDSVYVITQEGRIYLEVGLQGIDIVKGMVLFNEEPLEGVTVKISNLIDTTNQYGDFTITIPKEMQMKEYKVWFIKQGYKTRSAPAFPQTGPLEIVMEKKDVQ